MIAKIAEIKKDKQEMIWKLWRWKGLDRYMKSMIYMEIWKDGRWWLEEWWVLFFSGTTNMYLNSYIDSLVQRNISLQAFSEVNTFEQYATTHIFGIYVYLICATMHRHVWACDTTVLSETAYNEGVRYTIHVFWNWLGLVATVAESFIPHHSQLYTKKVWGIVKVNEGGT
jgi:hypothetical protein